MFKKHKFQSVSYPTRLEQNEFYILFDDTFKVLLKKEKLTKQFLLLLSVLSKEGLKNRLLEELKASSSGVYYLLNYIDYVFNSRLINGMSESSRNLINNFGRNKIMDLYNKYKKLTEAKNERIMYEQISDMRTIIIELSNRNK